MLQDKQDSHSLGNNRTCDALPEVVQDFNAKCCNKPNTPSLCKGFKVKIRELEVPHTLKFSRMACLRFNDVGDYAGTEVFSEEEIDVVLVRVCAKDFCDQVRSNVWEGRTRDVAEKHVTKRIVFVLEGLVAHNEMLTKKSYQGGDGAQGEAARSGIVPRDKVEQVLTYMRLHLGFEVHQVVNAIECGQYIASLASALARAPYKISATAASFNTHKLMRGQGIDEAHGLEMAWINMLMQIPKVTEDIARAISFMYPSFASLLTAYSGAGKSEKEKQELLQDLQRSTGNARSMRVGPAISKKVYRVFSCELPETPVDDVRVQT